MQGFASEGTVDERVPSMTHRAADESTYSQNLVMTTFVVQCTNLCAQRSSTRPGSVLPARGNRYRMRITGTREPVMRLHGSVVEDESGRPLEGLLVRAYDQDLVVDDHLGDTRTNSSGHFQIDYSEAQFRDVHETLPDIYVRIFDPSGKRLLHTTERQVRKNALVEERFEIRIPRDKLAAS